MKIERKGHERHARIGTIIVIGIMVVFAWDITATMLGGLLAFATYKDLENYPAE